MRIYRTFWKYNKDNWPGLVVQGGIMAMAIVFFILGEFWGHTMSLIFALIVVLMTILAHRDWRRNG